jgi:transmembrane sensor
MDPVILLRYLEGRASAAEREAVAEWLAPSEANREELARLEEAWSLVGVSPQPAFDIDALWERIRRELDEAPAAAAGATRAGAASEHAGAVGGQRQGADARGRAGVVRWRPAHVAVRWGLAAAALAIGVALLLERGSTGDVRPERPAHVYHTRPGEVMRLAFPDGSRAVLSGASALEVPRDYGRDAREIRLEGQAYFEVAHAPSIPFRVRTARMVVEDLGTRFSVTAYPEDERAEVAVAQGSVAITTGREAEPVVLDSADVAYVPAAGPVETRRGVAVERHLGWVDGVLHFDQESLADAARLIERRFGVPVRIADPALARRRFTGSIAATTLDRDLRALALLLDARYEQRGAEVVLSAAR